MVVSIGRDALIHDVRELTSLLENAHPDPYFRGGGRIAYHRRLQKLISSIPHKGMTKQEFFFHLQPFIAKIGDGHTKIEYDDAKIDTENPCGIPLIFDVVEEKLYVRAVTTEENRHLIGCILSSVEGVHIEELIRRQVKREGYENSYQLMGSLGKNLFHGDYLRHLIPEWRNKAQIRLTLRQPNGVEKEYNLPTSEMVKYPLIQVNDKIDLKVSNNRSFYYQFIGPDKKNALLTINDMSSFREAFEYWDATGQVGRSRYGRRLYKQINDREPPEDYEEVLKGIPSATELFLSLVQEMKEKNSEVLIVDLRENFGGLDTMNQILLYFLVGFDQTISLMMENAAIRKFSKFLNDTSERGLELEKVPYADLVPLEINDYDFSQDPDFNPEDLKEVTIAGLKNTFEKIPTFFKIFEAREFEAYYCPRYIVVLSSSTTFSSGFNLMTDLYRLGAVIIGTPSGQAGNSFGDIRRFELTNSRIKGNISTKYFLAFPDDPEKGRLLMPHYPLTYEKLASYNFDKNSTLLYALEKINEFEDNE